MPSCMEEGNAGVLLLFLVFFGGMEPGWSYFLREKLRCRCHLGSVMSFACENEHEQLCAC